MPADSVTTQPPTPTDLEALRVRLRRMWSAVAAAWGEHVDFVDARGAGVSRRMLELAAPTRADGVLELACGAGGVALELAPLLARDGDLVQSDFAPAMAAIASRRAETLGQTNVSTQVLDLEAIDQPDRAFDVVLCREGLMLVPDPGRALSEIRRVLRPGGRLVFSVWGPRSQNPWLGVVFDAVSEQLGTPMPPPGVPQPFSLEDAEQLTALLSGARFRDVCVEALPTPYLAASTSEWWDRTSALAGPLAQKLAALPEGASQALRDRAATAIAPYETPTGFEIPGLSLIASASRAVDA